MLTLQQRGFLDVLVNIGLFPPVIVLQRGLSAYLIFIPTVVLIFVRARDGSSAFL